MSDATRRTFLAAAGTSAAAAAAAAAPGAHAVGTPGVTSALATDSGHTGNHLVAYVEDARSGRLTVMYGENEVTVIDADLVRRLTRAARR